jgi:hypothetical protein
MTASHSFAQSPVIPSHSIVYRRVLLFLFSSGGSELPSDDTRKQEIRLRLTMLGTHPVLTALPHPCDPMSLNITEISFRSFDTCSRAVLSRIATAICIQLTMILPGLFSTAGDYSELPSPLQLCSSGMFQEMVERISWFFITVQDVAHPLVCEVVHAVWIIMKLIEMDKSYKAKKLVGIISEANLGTVLLSGILLSMKCDCDHPPPNVFWAEHFSIGLSSLLESEMEVLRRINFSVIVKAEEYVDLFRMYCL